MQDIVLKVMMHQLLSHTISIFVLVLLGSDVKTIGAIRIIPRVHSHRHVSGHGFHRTLITSVLIKIQENAMEGSLNSHRKTLLLKDTLPTGIYVDPFQIENMRQFGGAKVIVPGEIDIEQPEFTSPEMELYTYVVMSKLNSSVWIGNVTVPIHLRYHRSTPDAIPKIIIINNPLLFLTDEEATDVEHTVLKDTEVPFNFQCNPLEKNACRWRKLNTKYVTNQTTMGVPVGSKQHTYPVVALTLLFTTTGCYIVICAMYGSNIFFIKDRK